MPPVRLHPLERFPIVSIRCQCHDPDTQVMWHLLPNRPSRMSDLTVIVICVYNPIDIESNTWETGMSSPEMLQKGLSDSNQCGFLPVVFSLEAWVAPTMPSATSLSNIGSNSGHGVWRFPSGLVWPIEQMQPFSSSHSHRR